jgi:hypothetical protein
MHRIFHTKLAPDFFSITTIIEAMLATCMCAHAADLKSLDPDKTKMLIG